MSKVHEYRGNNEPSYSVQTEESGSSKYSSTDGCNGATDSPALPRTHYKLDATRRHRLQRRFGMRPPCILSHSNISGDPPGGESTEVEATTTEVKIHNAH